MKKFTKKLIVALVAVMAAVCLSVSLAACGGKSASVKAVYSADPGTAGTAKYQTTPMAMITTNVETVTLYDDNTYCLSVSTTLITGLTAVTGEGEIINRGVTSISYYGTYTSAEDSGIITLTLAKPTRLTITNTNTMFTGFTAAGHYDTANWNDETKAAFAANSHLALEDATAANVLNKFAFDDTEVAVVNGVFDYIAVSYHHIAMPMFF